MIVAGCSSDSTTGPTIATLVAVSGSGQFGALGSTLAQPLVVRVDDQAGEPVAGVTVTWTVTAGGGTVTPNQSVTDANGQATTSFRLGNSTGVNSVSASLGANQSVVFTATATTAPPSNLLIVSGSGQTGTVATPLPQDLVVKVTDAVGGAKSGVAVTFAVLSGGGSLSSGTAISDASGNATVKWTLGTAAGSQTVLASVSGITPVTITATGVAGAPDVLEILTGNNQTGSPGAPLPDSLRVRLTDRFDNPISGVVITWAPNPGDGTVNPATSTTDANGRAATRWTLGSTGGPKTLTASGGGFTQTFLGGGNVNYIAVSAGAKHSCALSLGGVAYCWGFNGDGQLGNGEEPEGSGPVFAFPQPTGATGDLTFQQLFGGRYHSCGSTLSSVIYCWGTNVDGRLGTGDFEPVTEPTQIEEEVAFSKVSAGHGHTCALDLGNRAFCWGRGVEGQLGVGAPPPEAEEEPVPVTGATLFSALSAGGLHTCAIAFVPNGGSGAALCWGNNAYGQLGDGSTADRLVPTAVSGGLTFKAISSGDTHTCGLTGAGAAYCWGNNANGQLGDNSVADRNIPTLVSGGLVFSSIAAGRAHTCAIATGNVVYCWGNNSTGQVGDGTSTNRLVPTLVSGGLVFVIVSAGDAHSCGITPSNLAYCWGDNQFGQIGDGSQAGKFTPVRVAFQP